MSKMCDPILLKCDVIYGQPLISLIFLEESSSRWECFFCILQHSLVKHVSLLCVQIRWSSTVLSNLGLILRGIWSPGISANQSSSFRELPMLPILSWTSRFYDPFDDCNGKSYDFYARRLSYLLHCILGG